MACVTLTLASQDDLGKDDVKWLICPPARAIFWRRRSLLRNPVWMRSPHILGSVAASRIYCLSEGFGFRAPRI